MLEEIMCKTLSEQLSYRVSEETLAETKKCDRDFSCQKKLLEPLCSIDYCVGGEVHFIKCMNKKSCSYRSTFGYDFICNCPTRKELYSKHGV